MPRLRRVRLASIGHPSARFDDVVLNFVNRSDQPSNSVLWLRNGGGKTSLLSLLFAGVRPHKRDFLGQRADQKIRQITDYVGPHDHGVVACEWELDTPPGLFNDSAPRYLTGVFYRRKEAGSPDGDTDIERLFFATLVSATEPQLTLDGLPLFNEQGGVKTRRRLNSFRRQLRQLDEANRDRNVFVEDKNQSKFEEELASHGIDPEVFFYQIRMNEREGGVSERFAFAEDEDFVDFLLEMTFDQRYARQVHEQLNTFRQEILIRNEQLKPELEYCQGLIARLHKLAVIVQERSDVYRATAAARHTLEELIDWSTNYVATLTADVDRYQSEWEASQEAARNAQVAAGAADRLAAAHQLAASRLRRDEMQADYDANEQEMVKAKRYKEVWQACVPLAASRDAQRAAREHRALLQQKLQEFAPQLEQLVVAATRLANALQFDVAACRNREDAARLAAEDFQEQAQREQDEASAAGERAAKDEHQAQQLAKQLAAAEDCRATAAEARALGHRRAHRPRWHSSPHSRVVRHRAEPYRGRAGTCRSDASVAGIEARPCCC